jgi:phosphoribosyl 1,2-cyclic phosphodiesterase
VPVYVHRLAVGNVDLKGVDDVRTFVEDRPFEVGGLLIEPFSIPHDTVEPVAFVISDGRRRVGVATDMGMPTRLVIERLRACRAVVLEFNHDLQMLMEGPYPWWLKQRVRGRLGHLSNDDALNVLEQIVDGEVAMALLGHLSQENNRPELVEALALDRLAARHRDDVVVQVLQQDDPGPLVTIDPDPETSLRIRRSDEFEGETS